MDPNQFLFGKSRETNIRRDAQGRWFDGAEPLLHPKLVRAFDRWLERAEDGRFCLKNDINWAYVSVEGAPLFVRTVTIGSDGAVQLTFSDERSEPLVAHSLRQDRAGALYCDARGGQLVAQFDRHAQQQLEPLLREDADGVYIALGGEQIRPPVVDDPLEPRTAIQPPK